MRQRPRYHPHITMDRHNIPPLVTFHWNLAFEDNRLGTVRHVLRVAVCPHTRSHDLMVLVRPILASLVPDPVPDLNVIIPRPINRIDKIFYATAVSQPSHHPQFIVITVFEETIRNLLVTGLADDGLFGVCLELERLHPQDSIVLIYMIALR